MNRFIGIGRLAQDVELRTTQSGLSVATTNIAFNSGKTQDGKDIVDFLKIQVWNKSADNFAKYCSKGSQIAVEGSIKNQSYKDNAGNTKYTTFILANKITFLDSKKSEEQTHNADNDIQTNNSLETDPYEEIGESIELSESDLPF